MSNPRLNELFTLKEAAGILGRKEYVLWYHAKTNVHHEEMGYRKFLTKEAMVKIAKEHMVLRDGEKLEDILARIEEAAKAKKAA